MRLLFCLFADSIGPLPKRVFRNLIQSDDRFLPKRFLRKLRSLFDAMSNQDRDFDTFGEHTIKYFNGGLFDSASIIELDTADLAILTKLYNARPAWLDNAHKALDAAVFAAYGWPPNLTDQEILARLLALNHDRAAAQSKAR